MRLSKETEAEYRAQLAGGREEVFGIALEALLNNDLERVKETLIDTEIDGVARLQGEAHGYRRILKYLKERLASSR